MTKVEQNLLVTQILDRLLPGDDADWPAAGALGLAPRVVAFMERTPAGGAALALIVNRLAADFGTAPAQARDEALKALETAEPDAFEQLLVASYNMYYTEPAVRAMIERLTGYENRPPQPLGYDLEPFDENLLTQVRQREPFWRRVDDG